MGSPLWLISNVYKSDYATFYVYSDFLQNVISDNYAIIYFKKQDKKYLFLTMAYIKHL